MKPLALIISCFDWYDKRLCIVKDSLEKEYDVKIISSDFSPIKKIHRTDRKDVYEYIHVPGYKRNMSVNRIVSALCFGIKVKQYIKKASPSLIYLLVPPNNTALFCAHYKKKRNYIFIADIIDIWPSKGMRIPFFRIWNSMRGKGISKADAVFTECTNFQEVITTLDKYTGGVYTFHLFKEQSKVVSDYVKGAIQKKVCSENTVRLAYLGSINYTLFIDKIAEIVQYLKSDGYNVEFYIIGIGEQKKQLISEIRNQGAEVFYHGAIYDELEKVQLLSSCDFGINIIHDVSNIGLTIKSIDYFSMGLPIINNVKGDTWSIVNQYEAGININEASDIVEIIAANNRRKMAENAFACYERLFTKTAISGLFQANIENVLRMKSGENK